MAILHNRSNKTLVMFGKRLAPNEMQTVDAPSASIKKHLFVRSGDVDFSASTGSAAKPKSKQEDVSDEKSDSSDE